MLELVAYSISLSAIAASAFSPTCAWALLALAVAWVLIIEATMKFAWDTPRTTAQPSSSSELVSRLGYMRHVPGVVDRFAIATLVVKTTALAIGLIGTINGYWLGLPMAMLAYVIMQYAAGSVDPSRVADQATAGMLPNEL